MNNGINIDLSNNKVGMGVTSPTYELDISSSLSQVVRINSEAPADSYAQVYIEGNKGGSQPFAGTRVELKSNIDYRAAGITLSTDTGSASDMHNGDGTWFVGRPYSGNRFN